MNRKHIACFIVILLARDSHAQVLQIQGGSSSLFDAHGFSATMRGRDHSTTIGAGVLADRFTFGLLAKRRVRRFTISVGDESVDFQLPTDLFGGSRYVPVRATGVDWTQGSTSFRVMGGTTSDAVGAPFFRGARSMNQPLGLLFLDRRVSPRLQVFSRTALSRRGTSIHGLSFKATPHLNTSAAAGVGSGKAYAASSASVSLPRFHMNAAYIHQQAGFRRLSLDTAEPVRENVTATLRPALSWTVSAGRQTLLGDDLVVGTTRRVTVNQLGTSVNHAGFRMTVASYASRQPGLATLGTSASVTRSVTRSIDAAAEYFRSTATGSPAEHSLLFRVQEVLGPRLSLLQTVNRTAGHTSFNVGGEFLSNPLRAAVSYQTVYAPLRIGHPFVHVVGVDLRVNLLDWIQVQGATYVTPAGRLRYTVSANLIRWISGDYSVAAASKALPPYVVQGVVRRTDGQPVEGAVIRLGGHVVITDSAGRFSLRSSTRKSIRLSVALDEFLAPGRYEIVSAPESVVPSIDGDVSDVPITIRRR